MSLALQRPPPPTETALRRLRLTVEGAVQGVGFRPFVFRLAGDLGLAGWVRNDGRGVTVEVEGPAPLLERFAGRLPAEAPPRAVVRSVDLAWLDPRGLSGFTIRDSGAQGSKRAAVLPDLATCSECLAEVLDPGDRRYRYPFTNCTHCGPRFSIVEALPYDRPNTTMRRFPLCPDCRREYEDPADRRFHAQPVACPVCGPRLTLADPSGRRSAAGEAALAGAAAALRSGEVVAVKGLAGFQLLVDARDGAAVARLRRRKRRPAKPLALMVRDLEMARALCAVGAEEAALLTGPEAPIVLLERRSPGPGAPAVSPEVAPGNPRLGVMLPATPLHHLLLAEVGAPLVATSGNRSGEPICTGDEEALGRLGGIADLFLLHDRPIARHADDGVAWVLAGEPRLLRRARGHAPLPVVIPRELPTLLAVGAHLKAAVALSLGPQVFLSQHLGDMEAPEARAAAEGVIGDFLRLYEARPAAIAHDLHPDYFTTAWARGAAAGGGPEGCRDALAGLPLVAVQHHHAHLASCLADAGAGAGPALGVVWDGTGYGTDGAVWGGEVLVGDAAGYRRAAHLRPFRLPGGEAAVREPRRAAVALLWELLGEAALERDDLAPVRSFPPRERHLLARVLERGLNAPWTTSAGRLFDGVAALLDLGQRVTFEGQAAMALEIAADPRESTAYPLPLVPAAGTRPDPPGETPAPGGGSEGAWLLDWRPLLAALLDDLERGREAGVIASRFHNALVAAIVDTAAWAGEGRVALTGGCFQNRRLTEGAAEALRRRGFAVLLHRQVPPNDGGIALGQVMVAAARLARDAAAPDEGG